MEGLEEGQVSSCRTPSRLMAKKFDDSPSRQSPSSVTIRTFSVVSVGPTNLACMFPEHMLFVLRGCVWCVARLAAATAGNLGAAAEPRGREQETRDKTKTSFTSAAFDASSAFRSNTHCESFAAAFCRPAVLTSTCARERCDPSLPRAVTAAAPSRGCGTKGLNCDFGRRCAGKADGSCGCKRTT